MWDGKGCILSRPAGHLATRKRENVQLGEANGKERPFRLAEQQLAINSTWL
jgi:hypothetical protein